MKSRKLNIKRADVFAALLNFLASGHQLILPDSESFPGVRLLS